MSQWEVICKTVYLSTTISFLDLVRLLQFVQTKSSALSSKSIVSDDNIFHSSLSFHSVSLVHQAWNFSRFTTVSSTTHWPSTHRHVALLPMLQLIASQVKVVARLRSPRKVIQVSQAVRKLVDLTWNFRQFSPEHHRFPEMSDEFGERCPFQKSQLLAII